MAPVSGPGEGLLRLLATPPPENTVLAAMDAAQWHRIGELAAEQRVEPLLHAAWHDCPAVPEALRAAWSAAYRAAALTALAQRARLLDVVGTLAAAGIPALALKGSWLAWHTYAAPAERPLRDLDVLVPGEDVVAAQDVLLAQGYRDLVASRLPAPEWAARYKHMPPLAAPDGVVIEVHTRLWDDEPRLPPRPDGLFARAVADPAEPRLRYLGVDDRLMHLAVHAAAHRFDGGPLMLVDFARIEAREELAWDEIWRRAADGGWDRALALSLAATDRWIAPGMLARTACPLAVPGELVEGMPGLLTRSAAERDGDLAALKLDRGNRIARIWDRRRHFPGTMAWLAWMLREVRGTAAALWSDPAQAARQQAMDRWLAG